MFTIKLKRIIRHGQTDIDMLRLNYITALVYGAEAWTFNKAQENKLEVADMRMLQYTCGITKLDKIRNQRIRRTTKVGQIAKKVQDMRLNWYGHANCYGHVMRRECYVGSKAMEMKVQGRRKRGRPQRRWLDKVKDVIKENGLSTDVLFNRATWRRMPSYPRKNGNKMREKKKITYLNKVVQPHRDKQTIKQIISLRCHYSQQ